MKKKVLRVSTVPMSLNLLLKGQLKMLNAAYDVVAVSSPGQDLETVALREGVRTVSVPMERHISPVKDLLSLWRLIRLFRKERPWMVHSLTPKAGLLAMMAARWCGVPVRVHTFTGLVFPSASGLKQKILILTDKITCACATNVNPEGMGVKHDLERFHITRKPLTIIGNGNVNGIDLDWFSAHGENRPEEGKSPFVFCFVGRIVGDKGINELIRAFLRLRAKGLPVRLLLVGDFEEVLDPVKPETKQMILGDSDIEFVGWQNDIRPYLEQSDAFVFPSYREGFPNTVLQAGAMGLPCIVTDINGCNEIIKDGVNGLIVPPRNEDSLYEAMERMANDRECWKEMAGNARRMIAERYEQKYLWSKLLAFYRSLE